MTDAASDDAPHVVHFPEAVSRYAAYAVVHRGDSGPPIGPVQHALTYRDRPVYLEQWGYPHKQCCLWVDHRKFAEYASGDGMHLVLETDTLRITRWGIEDTLVPLAEIDAFLGIAPLCPYR